METKFITGKLNSKRYIETNDEQVNTNYATRITGNEYIFQRVHRGSSKTVPCEQKNSYFSMVNSGLEYCRKLIGEI